MMKILFAYGTTLIAFAALDFTFLTLFGVTAYKSRLGDVMAPNVNFVAAVLFYLIYIGGVVYFAVMQGLQQDRWIAAAQNGAILGFIAYVTYDLTNLAVIRNWTWGLALIDIAWGIVVTAVAASIGTFVAARIG